MKNLFLLIVLIFVVQVKAEEGESTSTGEWKNAIKGGFTIVNSMNFTDVSATDGTTTSTIDEVQYTFEGGNIIGYERQKIKANDWGYAFGFDYGTEVEVESLKIEDITYKTSGGDNAKIQVSVIYFNWVYKWESFYIPFGVNYGLVNFTPAKGFNGSIDIKSGLGFDIYFGWAFDEHHHIEYGARSVSIDMTVENDDDGSTTTLDNGAFAASSFQYKYVF